MMRLSNKCVYALRALFDLGYNANGKPVQLKDVAERQTIPTRFLEQILLDLKRARLVSSKRGPNGGYTLAVAPEGLTVLDILRALDEAPAKPNIEASRDEFIDGICSEFVGQLVATFEAVTLADIMRRAADANVPRASYEDFVYVI